MSRKDYRLLADALRDAKPDANDVPAHEQWLRCINSVASALYGTNPLYNRDKFVSYAKGE